MASLLWPFNGGRLEMWVPKCQIFEKKPLLFQVGLVAKMQKDHRVLEIGGTLQQKVSNCLDMMHIFLNQNNPIVGSMVVAEKKSGAGAGSAVEAVAYILGIKDIKTVSLHSTLPELGMDSITGTEIVQTLERDFDIFVNARDMRSLTFSR